MGMSILVNTSVKLLFLCLCATIFVGVSSYASALGQSDSVHLGVFNSKDEAQIFYKNLPENLSKELAESGLWLDVYKGNRGFLEHYINITNVSPQVSNDLCRAVTKQNIQCLISSSEPLLGGADLVIDTRNTAVVKAGGDGEIRPVAKPSGLKLDSDVAANVATAPRASDSFDTAMPASLAGYVDDTHRFSSLPAPEFTPQNVLKSPEVKALDDRSYIASRDKLLAAIQRVGQGLNDDRGAQAAKSALAELGREAFEAAGNEYFANYLKQNASEAAVLSADAGSGETFIHGVKSGLNKSAKNTVSGFIDEAISAASGTGGLSGDALANTVDEFMLSSARGVVDSALKVARRSDIYALRNLELEYNLNDFDSAYFSILTTQPIHQSQNTRHNVFFQGGGIINEQSVDIDDDVSRHTLNLGLAYRYLTVDENYLLGANIFYDRQWPYHHERMSVGVDAAAQDLNFAANYYIPISDFVDGRTDSSGNQYEERALEGYDLELGYTLPHMPELSVFSKGYNYFRETGEDLRGLELSAEYKVRDNFTLKGAYIEENGGRDGVELALQYRAPLFDSSEPNLARKAMQKNIKKSSMREKIFSKVRRENRIRVEERIKADTPITIPNGDFAIIDFNNGAIANVSASGTGDVILEFNAGELTVTNTNGGFVQYISGDGGISVVNVPGGTVNLLGTDIDVTDDGSITTIQVRAGQVDVVPDVGSAVQRGDQGDIVSLGVVSGTMGLLTGAALEARQEAAFTSLDFINPAPPVTEDSAPFINVLPELITGPQFAGNNADLQITLTKPVTVSGSPIINGLVGTNARSFVYEPSASSASRLVFRYVFVSADETANSITINELDLNGGTIVDTVNSLDAVTAFTDTIVAINDATTPSIVSTSPIDDSAGFTINSDIVLTFNEAIQANIGNLTLRDITDGSDTQIISISDARITVAGTTVTLNPSTALELATDYELIIPAGLIQDTSGNAFGGLASGELNFSTASDGTPPALISSSPIDNEMDVLHDRDIVLTFDDNTVIGSGDITIHRTDTDAIIETIDVTSGQVTGGGTTVITINPASDFPPVSELYVLIPSTAFEDSAGNDFAGINATTELSFTTDTAAPTITIAPELITGPQFAGNEADIRLTFTEGLTVTGTPILNGLVGTNARVFSYNAAASSATQLVFRYIFVAGDVGAPDITVNDLDLNGGTIVDATNALVADTTFTPVVIPINDATAPSLISSSPVDDVIAVSLDSDIVLNFNETVLTGTGNITIHRTDTDAVIETINVLGTQVTGNGTPTITLNPTSDFPALTELYVLIPATAFADASGNNYAGISSTTELSFTTDTPPPEIDVPLELITGPQFIGNEADIRVTFDRNVTVTGTPLLNGFIGANARIFVYNAAASNATQLVFRHVYTAADVGASTAIVNTMDLNGGTILDAGNASVADISFATAVLPISDATAPSLISGSPVDDATGVGIDDNIVLTFNEDVQAGTGNIVITDTTDGSGTLTIPVADPQVTISGATVTINPSASLEFITDYDVTIAAGVIEDLVGNVFAGIATTEQNFTTFNDVTPPSLTSAAPLDDSIQQARNSVITLTFNEDVALAGTINLIDTDDASGDVSYTSASPEVNVTGGVITITPASDLEYAENYEVTWTAGAIQDLAGNNAAASVTGDLNFKTVNLEESLLLTLNITGPDGNINEANVQGSGVVFPRTSNVVFATDITITAAPNGVIFEGGGTGVGAWVGFNQVDGVLRARAGDGVAVPSIQAANAEASLAGIAAGDYTMTFEFNTVFGTVRIWLDEVLIASDTAASGFEGNQWAGTDNFGYGSIVSGNNSIATGEISTSYNGTRNFEYRVGQSFWGHLYLHPMFANHP